MAASSSRADKVISQIRASRRRLAFSIRSVMSEIEEAKVPKARRAELDFEQHLLEEAMEILLQQGVPSPADLQAERVKAADEKMLAKWDEEARLAAERGEDLESIYGLK